MAHSSPDDRPLPPDRPRDPQPLATAATLAVAGCGGAPPADPVVEYYPVPGQAGLPFLGSGRVGPMLYLSGQIGTANGQLVTGRHRAGNAQTFDNIRAVLERHGSSLDRVVKCTAMLADMSEWATMNTVYVTYFPKQLPRAARSAPRRWRAAPASSLSARRRWASDEARGQLFR